MQATGRRRGSADVSTVETPQIVRANAKYVRSSARKARLVVEHIRGRTVPEARTVLAFSERAVARDVEKVLRSAVANAEANNGWNGDELVIVHAYADEGPTLKRWRARARGRVARIKKRTCHITLTLEPGVVVEPTTPRRAAKPNADEAPVAETTTEETATEKPKRARRAPAKKKEAAAS